MKRTMRTAAVAAFAGSMMLATAGGAMAQYGGGTGEHCVSDQTTGWKDGPIVNIAPSVDVRVENKYDASQAQFKDGARIIAKHPSLGVQEIWEERWMPTSTNHVIRMHRLLKCEQTTPPPAPGGGSAGADLIRSGFGSGPVWASYKIVSGTVTVGDPQPMPPPSSQEP